MATEIDDHNLNFGAPLLDSAPSFAGAREMSRAAGDLGSSIMRASGILGDAALEVRDFRDKGAISEIRTMMTAAAQEHDTFRIENPDQNLWGKHWESKLAEVNKAAEGKMGELLPKNQIRLQEVVGEWSQLSTLGVRDGMVRQELNRAVTAHTTAKEGLISGRNYAEARDHVRDMPGATPEEIEAEIARIDQMEKVDNLKGRVGMYTNFEPGGAPEMLELLEFDEDLAPYEKDKLKREIQSRIDKQTADSLAAVGSQLGSIKTEAEFMARLPDWMDVRTKEIARRGFAKTEPLTPEEIREFEDKVDALGDMWGLTPMPPEHYEAERAKLLRESMALGNRPGADRIHRIIGQLTNEAQEARRANIQGELDRRQDEAVQTKMKYASGLYQDIAPLLVDPGAVNSTKERVMEHMQFWLATDGKEASYLEIKAELESQILDTDTSGFLDTGSGLPSGGNSPASQGLLLPEKP